MELQLKLLSSCCPHIVRPKACAEVRGCNMEHHITYVGEDRRISDEAVIRGEVERKVFESNLDAILLPDGHEGHRLVEGAVLKMHSFDNQLKDSEIIKGWYGQIMDF